MIFNPFYQSCPKPLWKVVPSNSELWKTRKVTAVTKMLLKKGATTQPRERASSELSCWVINTQVYSIRVKKKKSTKIGTSMASAVGLDNSDFYFITFYCSLQNDYVIMAQFNTVHSLLYISILKVITQKTCSSAEAFFIAVSWFVDNIKTMRYYSATLLPSKVNHFTTLITI